MRTIVCFLLGLTTTTWFVGPSNSAIAWQGNPDKKPALVYPHHQPITGRIVDEDGWPVIGAVVIQDWKSDNRHLSSAQWAPHDTFNRAMSDVTGKFKFETFDPGLRNGLFVFHQDFGVTQVPNPIHFFSDVVMYQGDSVSGRIMAHDGSPVEGARIRISPHLESEKLGFEYGVGATDGEGIAKLSNVFDGQVLELLVDGGFEIQFVWKKDDEFSEPERLDESKVCVSGKEFEYRLPKLFQTELVAISGSDGRPVEIEKAEFLHGASEQRISYGVPRTEIANISRNRIAMNAIRKGINRIRIYPTSESRHLVTSYDIRVGDQDEIPKKIGVEILEGALVSGTVIDESTGLPIADAAIAYESNRPGELLSLKIETSTSFVRSGEDGSFSMLVPPLPARLRVVGHCGNYQTLPAKEPTEKLSDGNAIRFLREIDPSVGENLLVDDFQLVQGPVVSGRVVDANGQPVEGVDYIVLRNHYAILRQPILGSTDKDGRFEIESVFTSIYGENTSQQNRTASRIFFWHPELTLSRTIGVNSDDATTFEELDVMLADSPAALGRVVDGVTKQPVAGVLVVSGFFATPFQTGAISRDDGTFLLEHLSRPQFRTGLSKREYFPVNKQFSFSGEQQLIVELDDIGFLQKFAFGKPETSPDISNLNDADAVESIASYISTQLDRLPAREDSGGWNASEPDVVFRASLFNALDDSIESLLNRELNPQSRVDAAIKILDSVPPNGNTNIRTTAGLKNLQRILLQNIDREGMLERVAAHERVIGWDRIETRLQVLEHSRNVRTRTWAATELVQNMPWKLWHGVQLNSAPVSDETFRQSLSDVFRVWEIGLTELNDQSFFPGETIGEITTTQLNALENRISRAGLNEARVRAIQEAIDKLRQHE